VGRRGYLGVPGRLQSRRLESFTYQEQYELEDQHWWFRGRREVLWSLLRRTGTCGELRVLDAGCGTGGNLVEFGALGPVTGVDTSHEALEFCRRRGIENVLEGRVEALPFASDSFDLVLATDVLEHVEDDRAALHELRRVTAPGGRLLATVPAYMWLWSQHDVDYHHYRRYTLRRLEQRVRECGWEPLAWTYFNSLLLAPIAIVRLVSRHGSECANGEHRQDLRRTPRVLNRALQAPMRAEARLIERGGRLPAGVSIGMVCRDTATGTPVADAPSTVATAAAR
jgi:SAM-dependent methyltransferase